MKGSEVPQPLDAPKLGAAEDQCPGDHQVNIAIANAPVEDGIEALDTVVRLIKKNTDPADPAKRTAGGPTAK